MVTYCTMKHYDNGKAHVIRLGINPHKIIYFKIVIRMFDMRVSNLQCTLIKYKH